MNTLKNYVIVGNICQLQIQDAGLNSVLGNRGTNNYRKICIKKNNYRKRNFMDLLHGIRDSPSN